MKTFIKSALLAVLFLAAGKLCAAGESLTVAVYDFTGDADAAGFGRKITTLVTADLTAETNLVMLERAELEKALSEQAFGISGLVSADAAARIGQMTGAKVLVSGQVIKIDGEHLVIVADIIGTETGRLFADKIEGAPENLLELTSSLSRNIAQTIIDQTPNLVAISQESREVRLSHIIKSINGTNRPSVSVNILRHGKVWGDLPVETELEAVLLKADFTVLDEHSDSKPEVEISGVGDFGAEPRRNGLHFCNYAMDVKIQERRTGKIIALEHQEGNATEAGQSAARTTSQINAADGLAEKILPLLAQ